MAAQNKKQTASSNVEAAAPPPAEVVSTEVVSIPTEVVSIPTEVVETTADDLCTRINAALEKTQSVINVAKELVVFFKTLQKDVIKLQKSQGKKPRRGSNAASGGAPVNRKPSGFAKPTAVSKELCDFLGVPTDRMLARTEVTRLLNKYIKDNSLQDPVDRRTIRPDGKLQKLLNIKGDMQLKYFNMQSYIKHHFIKAETATAAVAAV
jgi:chromatin remodeling complex protein RSC6